MKGLKDPGAQRLHLDAPMTEWEPAGHTVNISTEVVAAPPKTAKCIRYRTSRTRNLYQFQKSISFPHEPPPAINDNNTCYARMPPANIASPSFGSDVAARYDRATLRAAVVHIPLLALKMSTASAQGISNQQRQQKQTLSLATMPPTHAPPPAMDDCNTCYAPWPPANIASPSFGSDAAARPDRATLRAAVVHIPLLALKMSTVLKTPVAPAQGISNQQRQQKQTLSLATMPPTHAPPPAINDFNTCYAPAPPANIASPSFGSDVAARWNRATLRAAVVHIPLVALKMSTVFKLSLPAQKKGISGGNSRTFRNLQASSPPPYTTTCNQ